MPIDRDESPVTSDDDEDADGCLCGMEHVGDPTSDVELPPAIGGIQIEAAAEADGNEDNEDDVDGCELDFRLDDPTSDEELPVTIGGL